MRCYYSLLRFHVSGYNHHRIRKKTHYTHYTHYTQDILKNKKRKIVFKKEY
jgi:hypothetical protein